MRDPGPFGRDPDPTEVFPPLRDDPPTPPAGLPPIGPDRDPEPTRVMTPPTQSDVPTTMMPTGGGPDEPGPPPGGGGGGGGGGGDEPFGPEPDPWYRQPGPLAALIAGVAALVVALIALLVWAGDDDETSDDTLPTIGSTTTTTPASTEPGTTTTEPAPTTEASTTTSTSSTTTSTTSTTTLPPTTTTEAPTTTVATTAAPPPPPPTTTTTAPPITVPPGASAWQIIEREDDLSSFEETLACTGLQEFVEEEDPITVLAPSNAAFDQLRLSVGQDLCANPDAIESIIELHLIENDFTAAEIGEFDELPTRGGEVPVNDDGTIGSNSARIVVPDVRASNGLLHAVDAIVQP